ncbi:hypothetical protein ACHAWF_007796 [Thalassiosira exigua]
MEDDASTILESSLFYSCMSSATAFDENDRSGAAASPASACESAALDKESGSPPTPANKATSRGRTGEKTSSPSSDRGANSSSNSSWSVLSESERPSVRSINFNRDRTCLIVSTSIGVRIRTLESLHLSLQNLQVDDNKSHSSWTHDVCLPPDGATYAQLLHETSLLAVTRPSSPRCCFLFNAKNASSPLAALPLSAAVKRVELQRRVMAAMTVDLRLHVFHLCDCGTDSNGNAPRGTEDAEEKKALRPILITTLNLMHPSDSLRVVSRGVEGFNSGSYFDLSTHEDEPILVCKSFKGTSGTVRVYDPTIVSSVESGRGDASVGSGSTRTASSWDRYDSFPTPKKVKRRIHLLTTINAHDHSVTRMLIGGGGKDKPTYLATVSSKGTTIRVFSLPTGEHVMEWHRGSRPCQFFSLSWNGTADRLASYGSSGTIHIYDLSREKQSTAMSEIKEEEDDGEDFAKVHDFALPRVLDKPTAQSKPLLRRISGSMKRRASNSDNVNKHRSMAKLKYKPSNSARSQSLVLALLDRNQADGGSNELTEREDTLVVCSMDGELRQYSIKHGSSIGLIQIEDVLAR